MWVTFSVFQYGDPDTHGDGNEYTKKKKPWIYLGHPLGETVRFAFRKRLSCHPNVGRAPKDAGRRTPVYTHCYTYTRHVPPPSGRAGSISGGGLIIRLLFVRGDAQYFIIYIYLVNALPVVGRGGVHYVE